MRMRLGFGAVVLGFGSAHSQYRFGLRSLRPLDCRSEAGAMQHTSVPPAGRLRTETVPPNSPARYCMMRRPRPFLRGDNGRIPLPSSTILRTTPCRPRVKPMVSYAESEPTQPNNGYCSSSPVTDGERVMAWFGSAGPYCYDFAGKE